MDARRKALAILLTAVIAIAAGATIYTLATEKPKKEVTQITPSSAFVEPASSSYIDNSSIYLVSATSFYGPYPFASAIGPSFSPIPVIVKGNPCFIVNLTIRNDYTLSNLPPNQEFQNKPVTYAFVFLTVKLYDKAGNTVPAIDVTPPFIATGGAYASLQSGQNATVTIYMDTSQKDIDHFGVVLRYVGSIAPP